MIYNYIIEYNSYLNRYNEILDIVNSLSEKERFFISRDGIYKDSSYVVYRNIIHKNINNKDASGFVDLYKFDNDKNEVFIIIACNKNARGTGISNLLIESAIKWCEDNNIDRIIWRCSEYNDKSKKLAIKHNFVFIGNFEGHCLYRKQIN